jgi:hypothetical protein
MGGFANAWEKMIMSHRFNIQRYATCNLYVGLSSADPLDDRSGTSEPGAAKGYARVKTTNASATSWQVSDATGVTVNNADIITFAAASADWGTMTHFALFSGATAGASVLAYGILNSSKIVQTSDVPRFLASQLNICLK